MLELENVSQLIAALKAIMGNPWLLTFAALWVVAFWLKEYTNFNNKLIPTFIFTSGGLLGFFIIDKTFAGAILGLIMAYVIIGFYEHIKNTIEYFMMKKKPPEIQ